MKDATVGSTDSRNAVRTNRRIELGAKAKYLAQLAIVFGAYFGLAKAGLQFAFANQSVTSVWPATGLALAAVVIWGYRMWPAIAAGAFLANITTAGPLPAVIGITIGNTLEALAGAYLLTRLADFRPSLQRTADVFALVFYAAILSTMISATVGVASLSAAGLVPNADTLSTWRVWWFGDLAGDLLVAPALLVLGSRSRLKRRPLMWAEAAGLLVLLAALATVIFATGQSLTYLLFPVLFWVALRFRQPGIVIAGLVVSGIAIWFTARGHGPFVGGSEDAELLRSQTFVGVATITGLLIAALIDERIRVEERLRDLADRDPLTGLFNRRRFIEELERWVVYRARYGGRGAVLVVDIDNLKEVNDTLGHTAGDELIVGIADLLRVRLRASDVVGRWGGDEFTVLLPHADEQQGTEVAAAVLEQVHAKGALGGREPRVSVSIGVSTFGDPGQLHALQVLAGADRAMYEAKGAGRGRMRVQSG